MEAAAAVQLAALLSYVNNVNQVNLLHYSFEKMRVLELWWSLPTRPFNGLAARQLSSMHMITVGQLQLLQISMFSFDYTSLLTTHYLYSWGWTFLSEMCNYSSSYLASYILIGEHNPITQSLWQCSTPACTKQGRHEFIFAGEPHRCGSAVLERVIAAAAVLPSNLTHIHQQEKMAA